MSLANRAEKISYLVSQPCLLYAWLSDVGPCSTLEVYRSKRVHEDDPWLNEVRLALETHCYNESPSVVVTDPYMAGGAATTSRYTLHVGCPLRPHTCLHRTEVSS